MIPLPSTVLSGLAFTIQRAVLGSFGTMRRVDRLHAGEVGSCRTVAGKASDAVDARGLNGFGEGHRRRDGGEPPCEHRLARPRGAEQEDIMVRTPA
jgi:hypothetical protein